MVNGEENIFKEELTLLDGVTGDNFKESAQLLNKIDKTIIVKVSEKGRNDR